jgi:S-adenosylmethionine decarboxylase
VLPSSSRTGSEWIVEAFGCAPERLRDVAALQAVFDAAVRDLALHRVGDALWHRFPTPGGVTGLQMLAESHLTVHTFPEHASACFNLFCCTPRPAWDWQTQLAQLLGATDVQVRTLAREYAPQPVELES